MAETPGASGHGQSPPSRQRSSLLTRVASLGSIGSGLGRRESGIILEKTLSAVDPFKVQPRESTAFGGFLYAVFLPAVVAYTIYVLVLAARAENPETNTMMWTPGQPPFPLEIVCRADACVVSSNWDSNLGMDNTPETTLAYGESFSTTIVYSYYPDDGINVDGGEYGIVSHVPCANPCDCGDGYAVYEHQFSAGDFLLSYVHTNDQRCDNDGRERVEWFGTRVARHASNESTLTLFSFWNDVTVERKTAWLVVFGTFGGAYSLAFNCALGIYTGYMWLRDKKRERGWHFRDVLNVRTVHVVSAGGEEDNSAAGGGNPTKAHGGGSGSA